MEGATATWRYPESEPEVSIHHQRWASRELALAGPPVEIRVQLRFIHASAHQIQRVGERASQRQKICDKPCPHVRIARLRIAGSDSSARIVDDLSHPADDLSAFFAGRQLLQRAVINLVKVR